ncbi:MAG: hypothetical protein PHY15_05980 [Eubacteriales bacterium]|nr:hypothetical protein [Eubacteriales bacterium]MDD4475667.1 hypothetical protein [Eubacteriales bacterium]
MKQFNSKKLIAALLVALMVIGLMPTTILAADPVTPIPGRPYFAGQKLAAAPAIDGAVSEAAWTEGWETINAANGFWQNAWAEGATPSDFAFKYNFKWDDAGLYLAVVINKAPVNIPEGTLSYQTTATNIRLWLENNDDPAVRSHLYDYNFAADGTVSLKRADKEGVDNAGSAGVTFVGSKTDNSSILETFIPVATLGVTDLSKIKFWITASAPNIGGKNAAGTATGYNALNVSKWVEGTAPHQTTATYFPLMLDVPYFYLESPLDAFNKKIAGEDISIFTRTHGETVTSETGNVSWAISMVANWDEARQGYVVTDKKVTPGAGTSIDIPEDGIVLVLHSDGVQENKYQKQLALTVNVGDVLKLTNIDVSANTFTEGAKIAVQRFVNAEVGAPIDVMGKVLSNIALEKTYTSSVAPQPGYPDTDGKTLTDGLYAEVAGYGDAAFAGYTGSVSFEFVVDLGETVENLAAFSVSGLGGGGSGIVAPSSVRIYVSDDAVNFKYVSGMYDKEETSEGNSFFLYPILLENAVSGRYVKFEIIKHTDTNASGWTFIDEIEVYSVADAPKLYVTAINDAVNEKLVIYNPVADTFDEGLDLLEGSGCIELSTVENFSFAWRRVVVFKYDDDLATYVVKEVLNSEGGAADAADLVLSEGEFAYWTNTGNDYPGLWAGYTQEYKDSLKEGDWQYSFQFRQNKITPEISGSHNLIPTLVAGDEIYLYNINIDTAEIAKSFSYKTGDPAVQVNIFNAFMTVGTPVIDVNLPFMKGNASEIPSGFSENIAEGAEYIIDAEVNAGYPDTDGIELTDGAKGTVEPGNASWTGISGVDAFDFYVDLGEVYDDISKFSVNVLHQGWGIGAPVRVSYYVSEDGLFYSYVGDGVYVPELDGEDFQVYDNTLTLPVGVSAQYVKVSLTRGIPQGFSFTFISEFEAFTAAEVVDESEPAVDESEPVVDESEEESKTPPTGEYGTPIVLVLLVLSIGGFVVAKKRRA